MTKVPGRRVNDDRASRLEGVDMAKTSENTAEGVPGGVVDQFEGLARIRAVAAEQALATHCEVVGNSAEFTCSCGYPLGDDSGDLNGRHRAHVAEALAAQR